MGLVLIFSATRQVVVARFFNKGPFCFFCVSPAGPAVAVGSGAPGGGLSDCSMFLLDCF